ncbi:tetratricopeptide repeat protein [Shewanella baltica]|uniref:tetratricopeptide repeat protein n=1 Tax=Shewanella baltica TaxID=62322 RepID=UPI0039AF0266
MMHPIKTLISFATRWGPQFGGINCFNQDLLKAFAAAFPQDISTICVVLQADEEEFLDAKNSQVTLVSLELHNQKDFSANFAFNAWQKLQREFKNTPNNIVWLGHDRITGDVALNARKEYGGRSALINHMSYDHYESFCESSSLAHEKTKVQRRLFEQADIVIAVGPLLRDALADMLDRENIPMLVPGLPDIKVKNIFKTFRGFISGRLSDDAKKIKQGHLGVAAFALAISKADSNPGLPDALRGSNEPELTLRGIDFEQCHSKNHTNAEIELMRFAESWANRVIRMHALPFTTDRNELFNDLRSASVAMMPSWHEGFGLVGWEAIAAGVPLIVSQKSGLYRFLSEFEGGLYKNLVYPIDIAGSNAEPFFQIKDQDVLAEKIIEIAKSHKEAQTKAIMLREALLTKHTWNESALTLAKILDWAQTQNPLNTSTVNIQNQPFQNSTEQSGGFLEIPRPTWGADKGLSNSRLLRAEEAVIPFNPEREPFLEGLLQWAHSTDYPIAIQLLTGVGGTGKTRLALELCHRLQVQGWQTGFLANDVQVANTIQQLVTSAQKVCLVIDYAETRQPQLLELIKVVIAAKISQQVRILLLARDSGEWWSLLPGKDQACESLLDSLATTGPYQLSQLHDSHSSRQTAYQVAMSAFAKKLSLPEHGATPNLNDEHFGHPLYIQMAALLALHGEQPGSAESVARSLINHERRYWTQALSANPIMARQQDESAALFMALATLVNGLSTLRDCEGLWTKELGNKSVLNPLFSILAPLYPGRQGIQGLQPDLLGEALVAQCLLGRNGEALLHAVLGCKNSKWRRSSLTVIARMLRNREEISTIIEPVLTAHFVQCACDLVEVMIETPSPLAQVVEKAFANLSVPQKNQACGILDKHIMVEILPLIDLTVLVRRAQVAKLTHKTKKTTHEEQALKADMLSNLSVNLVWQGYVEEAAEKAKLALDIYEQLAKAKPERFEQGWAMSLNNYSNILGQLGSDEEAEVKAKLAMDIYGKLARTKSESFEPDWAMSLNNYSIRLSQRGRYEEAEIKSKLALDIYEQLAQAKPEQFEHDLAMSLNNYANRLSEHGRCEEAEAIAKKALDIREKLAKSKPERFQAEWAKSLSNYSNILSALGRYEEANVVATEALATRQKLAKAKPERFEPDWALTLQNYAVLLNQQGYYEEAEEKAKLALEIFNKLAQTNPRRFEYSYKMADLCVAHCNWLTGKQPLVSEHLTASDSTLREQLNWDYQRNLLLAFQTNEPVLILEAITKADECWSEMDATQKRVFEDGRLMLAGMAESRQIASSLTCNWREDLARFRAQRKERLPLWMEEVARRKGFIL